MSGSEQRDTEDLRDDGHLPHACFVQLWPSGHCNACTHRACSLSNFLNCQRYCLAASGAAVPRTSLDNGSQALTCLFGDFIGCCKRSFLTLLTAINRLITQAWQYAFLTIAICFIGGPSGLIPFPVDQYPTVCSMSSSILLALGHGRHQPASIVAESCTNNASALDHHSTAFHKRALDQMVELHSNASLTTLASCAQQSNLLPGWPHFCMYEAMLFGANAWEMIARLCPAVPLANLLNILMLMLPWIN